MAKAKSLIEQLQADALDRSVPITALLRKAKAAAVKLGARDFAAWVDRELFGYADDEKVPEYRMLQAHAQWLNPVRGWSPLIGGVRSLSCRKTIGEVEAHADKSSTPSLSTQAPSDLIESVTRQLDGRRVDVRMFVTPVAFLAIVDVVRSTLLDWALKLEQAGVRGDGLSFTANEAEAARSVNINIGSIGNAVGIGSFGDQATITATQTLDAKELAEGVRQLLDQIGEQLQGVPSTVATQAEPIIAELRAAASVSDPDKGRIRQGLQSLRHVMEAATGHVVAAGIITLIEKLLAGTAM